MAVEEQLGEPTPINGHRMQHPPPGPSWCIDCGEFYPEPVPCKAKERGAFDQRQPEGAGKILACIGGGE